MPFIKLGSYIINRLKEIGIDTIFGVPGDYTLVRFSNTILKYDIVLKY
jgi:TPP-dependent 2-oxoacid decarboxylase